MQRCAAALILIAFCLIMLGSGDPPFSAYENKKYGYRIDIPTGFVMRGDWSKQTTWIYLPEEKEKFEDAVVPIISVIASDIPARFSELTLYNTKVEKVRGMIDQKDSNYDDLETLDIEGGYGLMYREINRDDSQALNYWYVNIYGNGRYYIIEFSGTREQLREWRSEFKHVIESFGLI